MSSQFARFTARARQILSYAETNAKLLGHAETMPCHVLLAFYQSFESAAYRTVKELGVGADEVIDQIAAVYRRQPQIDEQPNVTDATRQLLQEASNEAESIGHMYVGTEHLVLGAATSHDAVTQAIFDKKG
jgi:ATP-dependent Clp protease ATP-binding subunit ClpC